MPRNRSETSQDRNPLRGMSSFISGLEGDEDTHETRTGGRDSASESGASAPSSGANPVAMPFAASSDGQGELADLHPEAAAAIERVFSHSDNEDPGLPQRRLSVESGVRRMLRLDDVDKSSYIERGTILVRLSRTLNADEWEAMIESKVLFPSRRVAKNALLTVENMIRREVSREVMPSSSYAAYLLMAMDEAEFNDAVKAGLLRSNVSDREIKTFKKNRKLKLQPRPVKIGLSAAEVHALTEERNTLKSRIAEIEKEKKKHAERVREINDQLKAEEPEVE